MVGFTVLIYCCFELIDCKGNNKLLDLKLALISLIYFKKRVLGLLLNKNLQDKRYFIIVMILK
jgi:hypothetical protein